MTLDDQLIAYGDAVVKLANKYNMDNMKLQVFLNRLCYIPIVVVLETLLRIFETS